MHLPGQDWLIVIACKENKVLHCLTQTGAHKKIKPHKSARERCKAVRGCFDLFFYFFKLPNMAIKSINIALCCFQKVLPDLLILKFPLLLFQAPRFPARAWFSLRFPGSGAPSAPHFVQPWQYPLSLQISNLCNPSSIEILVQAVFVCHPLSPCITLITKKKGRHGHHNWICTKHAWHSQNQTWLYLSNSVQNLATIDKKSLGNISRIWH